MHSDLAHHGLLPPAGIRQGWVLGGHVNRTEPCERGAVGPTLSFARWIRTECQPGQALGCGAAERGMGGARGHCPREVTRPLPPPGHARPPPPKDSVL